MMKKLLVAFLRINLVAILVFSISPVSLDAQQFRSPAIPNGNNVVSQEPGTIIQGVLQPAPRFQDSADAFVPRTGVEGLGLTPVRPRIGELGPDGIQSLQPNYSSGRSGDQERIIDQIRSGKFDSKSENVGQPGPQIIRQRYEDGKDQLVRHVIQDENGNYRNHGPWTLYNRRGEVVATGQFLNGLMDGTWERWHSANSSPMFRNKPFTDFQEPFVSNATFKNGKLSGAWVISDRGRRKVVEVPYRNGKRHGTATWWYPNSERMRVINFTDGALDGPMLEWNAKTELVRNDEFIDGQKVIRTRTMYRPKQPSSESYYLDAEMSLEGEDNWWDAEPAEYIQIGERVQHGPTFAWHENGLRKMVGQYQNDTRVGKFVWWHKNGQKALEGRYDDGAKVGTWNWWHENGMKSIEGRYKNNEPAGEWTWWDKSGNVTETDNFGDDSSGVLVEPSGDDSNDNQKSDDQESPNSEPPESGLDELEQISPLDPSGTDEDT